MIDPRGIKLLRKKTGRKQIYGIEKLSDSLSTSNEGYSPMLTLHEIYLAESRRIPDLNATGVLEGA